MSAFAFDSARLVEPDILIRLGVQFVLLCGSAFFSGSETALFSLSRLDLQQLAQRKHPQAATLHALLDEPRRLIVSILCGNELVNIAAVANMTGILVALFGEAKAGWIAVAVMLPLLLWVGEVTPKTIAVSNPQRMSADVVARPMGTWVRLVAPLRWVVRAASDRITTWLVGAERSREHLLQIDEFQSLVEDFAEAGRLEPSSRVLINNLLAAGATEIVAVMTPRSEDVLRLELDRVDLSGLSLDDVLRPPVVVPLTKKVDEMFDFFLGNEARAAAVLNEFGGVAGFITMKDVLRFIFGPLTTNQPVDAEVQQVAPDVYEAPGDTRLAELNRVTNFGLDDPRMTTIGGIAFRHLDRLPRVGDETTVDGLTITVLDMDAHRIARVRVARGSSSATPSDPPEDEVDGERPK